MSNLQRNAEKDVYTINNHLHNRQKWFGLAGTPSGETHTADRANTGAAPFVLTTGSTSAFGSWVQVFGSADTPVDTGAVEFDSKQMHVIDTNSTGAYVVQVIAGESADFAALLAAGIFSETIYSSSSSTNDSGPSIFTTPQIPAGTKVWARAMVIGFATKTISFYVPLHEYAR